MSTAVINDWAEDIQKAARKAASDWPGVIGSDDLAQDISVKILEAPGTVRDLSGMDKHARYQTIHKIAQRIASQERDDHDLFSGNFRYAVDEVRVLLEEAGDPERSALGSSWSVGGVIRSTGEHSDPTGSAGINNVQVSDAQKRLSQALVSLHTSNARQYDALVSRFVEGKVPKWEDGAARKLIDRALISLTSKMNHGHKRQHFDIQDRATETAYNTSGDGPGTRKALRSSTARYLVKEGYDSDYMPAPTHLRDNHVEPEVW